MKINYEEQLALALDCSTRIHDCGLYSLDTVSHLLFLICHVYNFLEAKPIMEYEEKQEVYDKIIELTNFYIKEGHEPNFDLGPNWWSAVLCECFALLKYRPAIWKMFDEDQQARITQLMKMYAYMWNFGCNSENSYHSGWGLKGNYGKWRGPNYRLSNNVLILFIAKFFGGLEEVDKIFLSFDYNTELEALKNFNFTNALTSWMTPDSISENGQVVLGAKRLLENGGSLYIKSSQYGGINYYKRGEGKGVKIAYSYQDAFPYGIIHSVYNNCFSGGPCTSSWEIEDENYTCMISDGTASPVEGKDGMMLEFNLEDDGLGPRSSLLHCLTDFYLVSSMAVSCWFLRISKIELYKNYDKIQTGITDFLYKLTHGYDGWCLGKPEKVVTNMFNGTILWANYWADHYNINLYDTMEANDE